MCVPIDVSFCRSKLFYKHYNLTGASPACCRGTLPYMAPELVSDPTHVSEKADVWSLGMVLWEMLTLQVPFSNLNPQQIVAGLMVGNLQPPVPAWCAFASGLFSSSC